MRENEACEAAPKMMPTPEATREAKRARMDASPKVLVKRLKTLTELTETHIPRWEIKDELWDDLNTILSKVDPDALAAAAREKKAAAEQRMRAKKAAAEQRLREKKAAGEMRERELRSCDGTSVPNEDPA